MSCTYKCDLCELGVNDNYNLEILKEAYYKQVRKFPPQKYPEKFIKVTKSYNNLIRLFNESISDENKYFKILNNEGSKESIEIKDLIIAEINKVTIYNFSRENDILLDTIIKLKNNKRYEQAMLIAYIAQQRFKSIGLGGLSDAYDNLIHFIIFNEVISSEKS